MRVGQILELAGPAQEQGAKIAIDGGVGEVIIAPSDEDIALLKERSERREAALADSHGIGLTYDGHKIALLANIGTAEDAQRAAEYDVEGAGLFRTEFLFMVGRVHRVLLNKLRYIPRYSVLSEIAASPFEL